MAAPTLTTYRDAIEHLIAVHDALPSEADQRRAGGAVQEAYRQVHHEKAWRYFTTLGRLNIGAQQTTGTVSFNTTDGKLTLTGATWPSWARYGTVRLENINYKVAELDADDPDTVITLDGTFRPSETLTDVEYAIWQSEYRLPSDLTKLVELHDANGVWSAGYVSPNEWLKRTRQSHITGGPFYWTVTGMEDLYGSMSVRLSSVPISATTLDFLYNRAPRPLKHDGYALYSSQGSRVIEQYNPDAQYDVVMSGGLSAITIGSVFRTPSNTDQPPGGLGDPYQYLEQRIIKSVSGANVEFDEHLSYTTGVPASFTVSDPIDLPTYLLTAFRRRCEYEMAIRTADTKAEDRALDRYRISLVQAMEADAQFSGPILPTYWNSWANSWWQPGMAV